MASPSESFSVAAPREKPYIEPTFGKVEFSFEKPSVILISAVGATGKTTLAKELSNKCGLPLLDLSAHKPVGDNTLSGLLFNSFSNSDLSSITTAVSNGTYGLIIDGIDEGRSKTTEKGFEAFLDDIVTMAKGSQSPSFVLLGRNQIIDHCWIYLMDKGVQSGLLTIEPFDLDQAKNYVDQFTRGNQSQHSAEYREVRDDILRRLASAFMGSGPAKDDRFMKFIGYPPVLDAIATLLTEGTNYHKIKQDLQSPNQAEVEVDLLYRIATYIMERERDLKVIPNVVQPLLSEMGSDDFHLYSTKLFTPIEQAARIVAHCLIEPLTFSLLPDPVLDSSYEEQLASFLPEHPFLDGRNFRNVVFEAASLAMLVASENQDHIALASQYLSTHRYNYHFVILLNRIAGDKKIPITCLYAVLGSAMEFQSTNSSIDLSVEGPDVDEWGGQSLSGSQIEIEIEVSIRAEHNADSEPNLKRFCFTSELQEDVPVNLGQSLANAYIQLPGTVKMFSTQEIEFTAPIEIKARRLELTAPAIAVVGKQQTPDNQIVIDAESITTTASSITFAAGVDFSISVQDKAGLTFPFFKYLEEREILPPDPNLKEKFLRLRKILVHFRSHSKGSLAKYKDKIENERVAGNEIGQALLRKLTSDGILNLVGPMYFLHPENFDKHLGVSFVDLRKGRTSDKLSQYLRSIIV